MSRSKTLIVRCIHCNCDNHACISAGQVQWLADIMDESFLSTRTYNCLIAEGIQTWQHLQKYTEEELLRIPNFGRKSLNELRELMVQKGYSILKESRHAKR